MKSMSDYEDFFKETEQFLDNLKGLPEIREADAWERRLQELVVRVGKPRSVVLQFRDRGIKIVMRYRGVSLEKATAMMDEAFGLKSPD